MKITIVQAEIYNAIDAYIRGLITVNEGSRIEINLRATRGEEGATAEIDIVPDVPEEPEAPVAVEEVKPVLVRRTRGPNKPKTEPVEVEEAAASDADADSAQIDTPENDLLADTPATGSEEALASEAAATEPAEEATEAKPTAAVEETPKPRQSLFSGLNKASTKND